MENTMGVPNPSLAIGILTLNFSAGTRSSCVQQDHCTSRMRSQPQLRNDKYKMIENTIRFFGTRIDSVRITVETCTSNFL